jgi:hypothetical protein
MSFEQVAAVAAGAVAVVLYAIGFIQVKRAFPKRGNWFITQAILTATGGIAGAALRGYGPVMWTVAPASIALVGFVAGKGSVAVLVNETDDDSADETPLPEVTVEARKRFAVIATVAVVVFVVGGTAFDLMRA